MRGKFDYVHYILTLTRASRTLHIQEMDRSVVIFSIKITSQSISECASLRIYILRSSLAKPSTCQNMGPEGRGGDVGLQNAMQ